MTAAKPGRPSRRERPAKPALTREGIVATAVELVRSDGLARVTMRRLAQELDTGPASLYVYLHNTAELHAAILDALLGGVELRPAAPEWRERLVAILSSYADVLLEYPGLAASALVARPFGPNYLDLCEALLATLAAGGIPDDRASWLIDLLLQRITAGVVEHGDRDPTAHDDWDALTAAIRQADAGRYPNIARLGTDIYAGTGRQRVTWALDVLINGALHTPRPDK